MTGDLAAVCLSEVGRNGVTQVHDLITTWTKIASSWWVAKIAHGAGNGVKLMTAFAPSRQCTQQALRIRMLRIGEKGIPIRQLHNITGVHDSDPVA
jgi:hypothetical protein